MACCNPRTILDLAHTRLEIIQGQIADLVAQTVEIHGAFFLEKIYGEEQ